MNAVIYSCLTGSVDRLIEPRRKQRVPMVMFTDSPRKSQHWECRDIRQMDLPEIPGHATSLSRWAKMLPHRHFPGVEYSVWVDANMAIQGDLCDQIPFQEDWVAIRHPQRKCVYNELGKIWRQGKDSYEACNQLAREYKLAGLPENTGMALCGLMWRRHTPETIDFCERWWAEFLRSGTRRDQPIWGYCQWDKPIRARLMRENHNRNRWIQRFDHVRRVPLSFTA